MESPELPNTPVIVENVLSMCLKEAVTNVVKHSFGTSCCVSFEQLPKNSSSKCMIMELALQEAGKWSKGHGLTGMRERLEFVNGSLRVEAKKERNLYSSAM